MDRAVHPLFPGNVWAFQDAPDRETAGLSLIFGAERGGGKDKTNRSVTTGLLYSYSTV